MKQTKSFETPDYKRLISIAHINVMKEGILLAIKPDNFNPNFHVAFNNSYTTDEEIPEYLRKLYPETMVIVLQKQFKGVKFTDTHFEVTLWFSEKEEKLCIPYNAICYFKDRNTGFIAEWEPYQQKSSTPEIFIKDNICIFKIK